MIMAVVLNMESFANRRIQSAANIAESVKQLHNLWHCYESSFGPAVFLGIRIDQRHWALIDKDQIFPVFDMFALWSRASPNRVGEMGHADICSHAVCQGICICRPCEGSAKKARGAIFRVNCWCVTHGVFQTFRGTNRKSCLNWTNNGITRKTQRNTYNLTDPTDRDLIQNTNRI